MANTGDFDLPGRGFMCQMPVNKGLFNLPSHFDAHKHNANMQQVIGAIDHLMGTMTGVISRFLNLVVMVANRRA